MALGMSPALLASAIAALFMYGLFRAVYNLYSHPLARFPGSRSWAASRLPFLRQLLNGRLVHRVEELHRHYGPIVRVAPNELSFAHPDAWNDIFQSQRGQFLKDPIWWGRPVGQPVSLLSAPPEPHARIRKLLSFGFTERALSAQEPIVQKYVGLLITRLRDVVAGSGSQQDCQSASEDGVVDLVPWFNFTTFDIFGDLGYGESFDCLQHSRYQPWIALLFNSVKATSFMIVARFFPSLQILLLLLIPRSLLKMRKDHQRQVADKVQRRLNWEVERSDFMSHVVKYGDDEDRGMSIGEIEATFVGLTTAGSETTATVLSGTINYLVAHPEKLVTPTQEVRDRFASEAFELEALRSLPYLNAVISEGLRLCPPVPTILPRLVPEGGAMICGAWIPGGTSVSLQAWTVFRDPTRFFQSTSFIPERWLPAAVKDPSSPFAQDQRHGVQPFGLGARSCLGQQLAWAEMRLVLARLVWAFDVEAAGEPLAWPQLRTFLLVEKKPVQVRLRARK